MLIKFKSTDESNRFEVTLTLQFYHKGTLLRPLWPHVNHFLS